MSQLQEFLPEAISRTNAAEDQAEKAAITAEMMDGCGDDLEEVRRVVDQTEAAAKEAQAALGEARIFLNAKVAVARRLQSQKIRDMATVELGKLQKQLQDAQTKLNPIKTIRQ